MAWTITGKGPHQPLPDNPPATTPLASKLAIIPPVRGPLGDFIKVASILPDATTTQTRIKLGGVLDFVEGLDGAETCLRNATYSVPFADEVDFAGFTDGQARVLTFHLKA